MKKRDRRGRLPAYAEGSGVARQSARCARRRQAANFCQGFTLIELLVATLVMTVVAGAVFALMNPARTIFQVQPEYADAQQRLRVGIESVRKDLMMAGAGTYTGPAAGPLNDLIGPVMPYRAFGNSADTTQGIYFRPDAISVLYIPNTPSQTTLAQTAPAQSGQVTVTSPPNCPPATATRVCGFDAGDDLVLFDDTGSWDLFTVAGVLGADVQLAPIGQTFTAAYGVNAIVAEVKALGYFLKSDAATNTYQLMLHDGRGPDQPVVDNVVRLDVVYFGDTEPPQLTGQPLGVQPGPWTTYGLAPPPITVTRGAWPPGENCTFAVVNGQHAARLPTLAASSMGQAQLAAGALTDGPWCPDAAKPNRFDADLLRIRRIRLSIRVQSALASLRGPAGALFMKGGTARAGDRFVPDQQIEFDVSPRNLARGL